jgi:NADH-ubiquinone oxidoreductase chain 4
MTPLSFFIAIFALLRFLIKLPVYGLHLWLPKAHVEAPVSGSMILAAILLKLALYGLYRFIIPLKKFFFINLHSLSRILIWRAFIRAIVAIRQSDAKSLVAYSSVSHMGVILVGVTLIGRVSVKGAVAIILAHGFCSSALFFLVNFHYERSGTRQLVLLRGQGTVFFGVIIW